MGSTNSVSNKPAAVKTSAAKPAPKNSDIEELNREANRPAAKGIIKVTTGVLKTVNDTADGISSGIDTVGREFNNGKDAVIRTAKNTGKAAVNTFNSATKTVGDTYNSANKAVNDFGREGDRRLGKAWDALNGK